MCRLASFFCLRFWCLTVSHLWGAWWPGVGCLVHSHLMFYLALHFNTLRCRSLYLPATVSPDCSGNSALPVCNETGQRLEQLNRRDNQSLIQTAMQNIQAIASEIVLSGILDFRLHLINLWGRRWNSLMDLDRLGKDVFTEEKKNCQLSWRQIKNKYINIYCWHTWKCGASSLWWGIWFHAAVIHFHLECSQSGENRPCWSRSVNSLMPADVCCVLVGKRVKRCPNSRPGDVWCK